MENSQVVNIISNMYINYYKITDSKKYIEIFFNKILSKIKNNINIKLLLNGLDLTIDSDIFDKKYHSFVYNFMNILDPKSDLYINDTEKNKIYMLHNFKKYIIFSLLVQKIKNFNIIKTIHAQLFKNFALNKIIKAKSEYLNPAMNKLYIENIELRSAQKLELTISRLYTCKKCKNNKTKYNKIQTRSGDEGPTIFIKCVECDNRWAFNA